MSLLALQVYSTKFKYIIYTDINAPTSRRFLQAGVNSTIGNLGGIYVSCCIACKKIKYAASR